MVLLLVHFDLLGENCYFYSLHPYFDVKKMINVGKPWAATLYFQLHSGCFDTNHLQNIRVSLSVINDEFLSAKSYGFALDRCFLKLPLG